MKHGLANGKRRRSLQGSLNQRLPRTLPHNATHEMAAQTARDHKVGGLDGPEDGARKLAGAGP